MQKETRHERQMFACVRVCSGVFTNRKQMSRIRKLIDPKHGLLNVNHDYCTF